MQKDVFYAEENDYDSLGINSLIFSHFYQGYSFVETIIGHLPWDDMENAKSIINSRNTFMKQIRKKSLMEEVYKQIESVQFKDQDDEIRKDLFGKK